MTWKQGLIWYQTWPFFHQYSLNYVEEQKNVDFFSDFWIFAFSAVRAQMVEINHSYLFKSFDQFIEGNILMQRIKVNFFGITEGLKGLVIHLIS